MNKITVIIVVLLAIVGIYFVSTNTTTEDVVTKNGEVVEVDLEQMTFDGPGLITILDFEGNLSTIAIPSMGIQLCPALENISDISTVAVGDKVEVSGSVDSEGNIVPCDDKDHYLRITGFMGDAVYGYEFAYRKGPDGYIVIEDNDSQDQDYVTGLILFNKKEYEILQNSTEPREGPPAMHLRIYKNPLKLHAPVWASSKPRESNIELIIGETEEAVVGGANATHYVTDGLYPINTYVVANGEHVYVLMGSYLDTESQIYKDFQKLVSSFTFTPHGSVPQGKIDVRVACESALAYMTFTSGNEADAFVEACVLGEHPEVIDRYIKDMGLNEAVI